MELEATLWLAEGGAWKELFQGRASELTGGPLYTQSFLPMGTTVDLAAQITNSRGSNEVISTTPPSPNVIALTDGDPLPTSGGAFQNGTIASFLSPYVNEGRIQLGPLQVIYLFDLDGAPGSPSYGLQDLGVLVSVKPNERQIVREDPPMVSRSNRGRRPRDPGSPRSNGGPQGNDPRPRGNDTPGAKAGPVGNSSPGN